MDTTWGMRYETVEASATVDGRRCLTTATLTYRLYSTVATECTIWGPKDSQRQAAQLMENNNYIVPNDIIGLTWSVLVRFIRHNTITQAHDARDICCQHGAIATKHRYKIQIGYLTWLSSSQKNEYMEGLVIWPHEARCRVTHNHIWLHQCQMAELLSKVCIVIPNNAENWYSVDIQEIPNVEVEGLPPPVIDIVLTWIRFNQEETRDLATLKEKDIRIDFWWRAWTMRSKDLVHSKNKTTIFHWLSCHGTLLIKLQFSEGLICKIQSKWSRVLMVWKNVPQCLWGYGLQKYLTRKITQATAPGVEMGNAHSSA